MCFHPRISEMFRKESRKGLADSRSLLFFMTWFLPGAKGSSSKERGGGHVAISTTSRRPKPPFLDPFCAFCTSIEWPCDGSDWFLPKLAPQVLLHLDSSWVLIISPVRNQPGICFFCCLGCKKTWDAPPGIESHWNTVTASTTRRRTSHCFRGLLQVSSRRCRWSRRASYGRMVFRLAFGAAI